MKRLFLLLLLVFAFGLTAFAQHQRRVLLEEFTNASCPPCASQNPALNATIAANIQYLTPIKYQVWWPGFDPMYNQTAEDVDPRVAYYNVNGVPDAYLNGTIHQQPVNAVSAAQIQNAYNTLTPVSMVLTHELTAAYDTVKITVAVTSAEALAGDLRLRVAVTEKEILFDEAPGTNGEADFYDVMRKMLGGAAGTETGDFAAGETKTYSFAWKLQNIYNLNEVGVVAWLQNDGTKEVYQSERSAPNTVIPDAGASILLSASNANQTICSPTVTPQFTLKNTGTDTMTNAVITYTVDGGAAVEYNWEGSLLPNQQTTVSLPQVILPATSVAHEVVIAVASTNNGIQTNQVSAGAVMLVNAYQEVETAPSVSDFEASVPPANWGAKADGASAWEAAPVGGFNLSEQSAFIDFYSYAEGTTMDLLSPKVDLTGAAGQVANLSFDYAYAYYNNTYKDRMQIAVSTDCGATWTTIWDKSGAALQTSPPQTAPFVPNANQWVNVDIDLSAYAGEEVIVRFRGISGYGNNLYLDNVNLDLITGTVTPLELSAFTVQPNPARGAAELRFTLANAEQIQLNVFNAAGALVQSRILGDLPAGAHQVSLDAASLPAGSYRVSLQGNTGVSQLQWIVVK